MLTGMKSVPSDSVASNVFHFLNNTKISAELYIGLPSLAPSLQELNDSAKELLSFCTSNQVTLGEARAQARAQYRLQARFEARNPVEFRPISKQFSDDAAFASYLDKDRKRNVRLEGWKKAMIRTDFGLNETGVFRSEFELLFQQLERADGISAIVSFAEEHKDGKRSFSAPWNANAMRDYQKLLKFGGHLVGIDLFSDGATLSKSGSQSANSVRVRFINISGISEVWHEIGTAPSIDCGDERRSETDKRGERMFLFQRYLFIALKDLVAASAHGVVFQGAMLFPRIVMIFADQKQERVLFRLKSADSYADCTLCTTNSQLPVKRKSQTHAMIRKIRRVQ